MCSLCLDNGTEFSWYKTLEYHLGIDVSSIGTASPYQRGSNENTNGLIRRYLPKKTEFTNIFQKKLDGIAHSLNNKARTKI